jgi:hypothetical protein
MNWINYESFQGQSAQSDKYTELPDCFTSKVPASERQKPIWTVRDTYSWSDQIYSSWDTCKASLTSMCKAHLIDSIRVDNTAGASPYSPYFAMSTMYSNARDKASTTILNTNSRWLVFNASKQSCPTVCSTVARTPKSLAFGVSSWNAVAAANTALTFSSFAVTSKMNVAYAVASPSSTTLLRTSNLKGGAPFQEVTVPISGSSTLIGKVRVSDDESVMLVQTSAPANSAASATPSWWLSTDGHWWKNLFIMMVHCWRGLFRRH